MIQLDETKLDKKKIRQINLIFCLEFSHLEL